MACAWGGPGAYVVYLSWDGEGVVCCWEGDGVGKE